MNADGLSRIAMSSGLAASLSRATEYARAQAHAEVTLEHILLALCDDPDAVLVLAASNINVGELTGQVGRQLAGLPVHPSQIDEAELAVAGDLRRILEAAAAAARGGRRREINGAIVLAAIVGDGKSAAAHILSGLGLTFEGAIRALQSKPTTPPTDAESILAGARERVQSRTITAPPHRQPPIEPPPEDPVFEREEPRFGSHSAGARPEPQFNEPELPEPPPQQYQPMPPPAFEPPPAPAPYHEPEPQFEPPAPHAEPNFDDFSDPRFDAQEYARPQYQPDEYGQPPMEPPAAEPSFGGGPPPMPASPPFPPMLPPPPPSPHEGWAPPPSAAPPAPSRALPPPPPRGAPPPAPAPFQASPPAARPGPPPLAPWPEPERQFGTGPVSGRLAGAQEGGRPLPPGAPATPGGGRGAARNAAPRAEIGQLVENIPRSMRVSIPAMIEVRVARADVKALAEGLQGGGAAYQHEITVTKAMSVRLRAPDGGFFIETASPETQWIERAALISQDDFASWRWHVTPRDAGRKRLQLVISARTMSADGMVAETALPDQVITVRVRTNYSQVAARWVGWGAAAVAGGLLAKFGEGAFAMIGRMFGV
jgi:hypothetical protein